MPQQPNHKPRSRPWPSFYRALLLALAFACIGWIAHQREARRSHELEVSIELVRKWFPNAASLGSPSGELLATPVLDAEGLALGQLLQTSPSSDRVIGYAGPTNVLIALDPQEKIRGFQVLESADTTSHLALIEPSFWNTWIGTTPTKLPENPPLVSGATLTSSAIAKSIAARLQTGEAPETTAFEPTLEQAQQHLESAAKLIPEKRSWKVLDQSGATLGHLISSLSVPKQIRGFQGPSHLLLVLDPEKRILLGTTILSSRDNESYVEATRDELRFASPFAGKAIDQIVADTTPANDAFLVSGASRTATAVVEQIRQTLTWYRSPEPNASTTIETVVNWQRRDTLLSLWLLLSLAVGLSHWRGKAKVRIALQLTCVGLGGIYLGVMLSQGLLFGWATHGIPWQNFPSLVLLGIAAFTIPFASSKNVYCHQICPHGAVQNLLFDLVPWKLTVPKKLHVALSHVPWILLLIIFALMLLGPRLDLAKFEVFDAWSTGLITLSIPAALLILSLITAPFIRTPYCHYGCPTGALLRYSASPRKRWMKRDLIAGLAVLAAWIFATMA